MATAVMLTVYFVIVAGLMVIVWRVLRSWRQEARELREQVVVALEQQAAALGAFRESISRQMEGMLSHHGMFSALAAIDGMVEMLDRIAEEHGGMPTEMRRIVFNAIRREIELAGMHRQQILRDALPEDVARA